MKSILIFSLILQAFISSPLIHYSYIKLEYIGDIDKPMPGMVFFVNSYDLNKSVFVDTFKISKIEFASLANKIKANQRLFENKEVRFYRITIFDGTAKKVFFVRNKQNIEKAFKELEYQLRSSKEIEQIRNEFANILGRI